MKKIILFLIITFLLPFFLIAQKDSTNVEDLMDLSLEDLMNIEVSGVSRYAQNLSDVPNSIQVITQQQITDRGYNDLSDLLKDVQGFDITSNAGRFGEYYSFRGIAGNDRFLIMINGNKLNPATGTHVSIGNSISIRYAERVEIIYGPASAVYGADAFSGIINVVMKDTAPDGKFNIAASANYGSLNSIDGALSASAKIGENFSINLNARIYKSDGFDFVGTDDTYDVINDYLNPAINKCEQPTNDHNIYVNANYKDFSINYYRQQFDEGNAASLTPGIYIYNKENKYKFTTDIIAASYKKTFANEGNLNFNLSYKSFILDNNSIYYKWTIPNNFTSDTYSQFLTEENNTVLGVLTYNQAISEKIQFIVGIDNEYTTSIPPYANDEVLGQSGKYGDENAKLINDGLTITENRFAGFGQLVYSPIDIIDITMGARYDYSTRYEGTFNPRFGIVISPTSSTKIKLNYGRAFQAPSLFYQYEQFGAPTVAMLSSAEIKTTNPAWELKNQTISSYEISLTQKINDNFEFKIDAYYNDLTNLIERNLFVAYPTDSVYNKYFNSYTSGLRNENIGSQKIIGGDFSFNAKISKNIILYTYYSYTDAISIAADDTETDIPRISENKIWIGLTAQNLFNYLTISPRFKWVSDMYNSNTTVFADNKQKGYYTLDLNLSVNNLSKYFRIYANFENITDNKIEHGGLYSQSGIYTATIPQQGFAFRVGIEIFLNK